MSDLLNRVLIHEGFREKPYRDTLGVWTIGHGLTWISEDESRVIVKGRLAANVEHISKLWPWLEDHPQEITEVIIEMSYQLGVAGVGKFKNMLAAIQAGDYSKAAMEGIDSRWAKQTPSRAIELMNIIREQA